tara:strand:- start:518 stop:850 length:333 start_codon:yes stop_codon:yes gene_type:complete
MKDINGMINKITKITVVLISFIFLTGFIPLVNLIGPTYTAIKSGSIYKAGAQYFVNKSIKDKTGKNSLDLVKEKLETKRNTDQINNDLKELVKRRIELARKKLNLTNINQ